jgi:hypothetical protein
LPLWRKPGNQSSKPNIEGINQMGTPVKKTAPAVDPAPAANSDSSTLGVVREPVTARGADLVKLIAAADGLYLTQDEGSELVAGGFAKVNIDDLKGETAMVQLTDAGRALIAPVTASKVTKPVIEIDDDVPMPEAPKKRGGKRGSKYPFEKLEIGKSFHVPKTAEMENPVSALASSLTGARRRFEVPVLGSDGKPVMETVKVKTFAQDATGKRVKVNGKFVVTGEATVTKPKTKQTRDFQVFEVGADDPKGPGARVYRVEVK